VITNVIVALSLLLSVLFAAAWWAVPDFRAWLEQPKHRFQDDVQRYDRERSSEAAVRKGRAE
jgi:hypothetical protein